MLKQVLQAAACAGLMFAIAPVTANAAPLATAPAIDNSAGGVENVHWRSWRHCHWRHGERFCHRGRRSGWYNDSPGIYLNFGSRRHHRHHDRDHDGDDRRRH